MNKYDLNTLINFNYWANGRILDACERLTQDEYSRAVTPDPGWGSLRGILVHTMDTEFGWRLNLLGEDASLILGEPDFPDLASLIARWEIEKARWHEYLADLSDQSLNEGFGKNPQTGPRIWQAIMHVVAHGIQHRSEAAWILTGYGHSPGELDFGVFLSENPDPTQA